MQVLLILLALTAVIAIVARLRPQQRPAAIPVLDLSAAEPQVRAKIEDALAMLTTRPRDAEAWGQFGIVLHAHGFMPEARDAYGEAHRLAPREFRWVYFRGVAQESNDPAAALRDFEAALQLRDDFAPLFVRLGRTRYQTATGDAVAAFHRALELNPDIGPAHAGLGQVAQDAGDFETALSHFRSAVLIDETDGSAYAAIARLCARQGLADEAASAEVGARRFAGRTGYVPDPLMDRVLGESVSVEAYLTRSESYRRVGNFDAALTQLNAALKLAPDNPYAHAAAARLFGQRGDLETAVQAASHALELKPDLPGGRRLLAMAFGYQNKLDEAAPHIAAALAEDPADPEMHQLEGVRLATLGHFDEAITHLEAATKAKPQDDEIQQTLVQAYLDADRPADAVRMLRTIVASAHAPPSATLQLGWLLATCANDAVRNGAEAESLLRPMITDATDRPIEVLNALAAAVAEQGRFEEAIQLMSEVVTVAEQRGLPEAVRRDLGSRLALYRQNRPFRLPAAETR